MGAEMKDPVTCVVLDVTGVKIGNLKWLNLMNWQSVYVSAMETTPTIAHCCAFLNIITWINEYYLEMRNSKFRIRFVTFREINQCRSIYDLLWGVQQVLQVFSRLSWSSVASTFPESCSSWRQLTTEDGYTGQTRCFMATKRNVSSHFV